MIGEIVGILADKGRHTREMRNTNIPSDGIYQGSEDIWSDVLAEARRRGMEVRYVEDYVEIGQGSFQGNEGGAMLARKALGVGES